MFWRRKRSLQDFTEELQSHIGLEADQLRECGQADPEVMARRDFGNITSIQERFYERGRWLLWDHLLRDLRHAFRLMRNRPGFSAVVIVTLALGIGANTAIFSVINAVLLRPLPYKDPGRLAMLWMDDSSRKIYEGRVSLINFQDWKDQSQTFAEMTLYRGQTFLLGTEGAPERLRSARVPSNFFSLLGIEPIAGRGFTQEEEDRGERVVVLSYGLWQRRFGGSAQAIGSDLLMDGRASRIIGVMPPQFQFPFANTVVWEPLTAHPYWARDKAQPRFAADWYVLGRIKRDTAWRQAQAEMKAIGRRIHTQYPEISGPADISVVPLHAQTTGRVRLSLSVLFGSVFLMLLIACTNVANLLLARGSAREREFALRRALGAGRLRLAGQLLTESLVLAVAGGLLGLLLAAAGVKALIAFGPRDIPRLAEARIDFPVLMFTVSISLFCSIVSGLWPAMRSGTPVAQSRQWTTIASRNLRSVLMAAEFSLALVLLAGAGLMVRSFMRLQAVDPGFRSDNLLAMRIDLHVGKTAAQEQAYFRDAIERVQSLPSIRSVAAISSFLLTDADEVVAIEGRPEPGPEDSIQVADDAVSGPYFQTVGIPLKAGRFFSDHDGTDSLPVAIINDAMVRRCWPAEDPIGKRFRFAGRKSSPWYTVIGIVGDSHRQGIEKQVAPQVFQPHNQFPDNEMDVLVSTTSDPLTMAAAVRDEIESMDKTVAQFPVTTVERELRQQTAERRFYTSLIGLFSLVALFLSAIGIYGLMHYFVVQRTNEIGVRMALGARHGNVITLVLRHGLMLAGIGIAAGIFGAFWLTQMLSSLLFGVTPTDPVTFASAPAILLSVATVACWLPAHRAARIDPVVALRQD